MSDFHKSPQSLYAKRMAVSSTREQLERERDRPKPEWHRWVYGGKRPPELDKGRGGENGT